MSTFNISFSNLWTYVGDKRLPLARLSKLGGHVHGCLKITVNGRPLPYLAYFGENDVCFNTWAFELKSALEQLSTSAPASYIFDEGEQGQPAFKFERDHTTLCISIIDSQISDGVAHPEWQKISCDFADFENATANFLAAFKAHLEKEVPQYGNQWWSSAVKRSA